MLQLIVASIGSSHKIIPKYNLKLHISKKKNTVGQFKAIESIQCPRGKKGRHENCPVSRHLIMYHELSQKIISIFAKLP